MSGLSLEISKKNGVFQVKSGNIAKPPIAVQHTAFAFEDLVFAITAEKETVFDDVFIINDPVSNTTLINTFMVEIKGGYRRGFFGIPILKFQGIFFLPKIPRAKSQKSRIPGNRIFLL